MKEAYAVRRTVPPSAEIEAQIDRLLAVGVGENPREALSELAKLGARLIIQRAVEEGIIGAVEGVVELAGDEHVGAVEPGGADGLPTPRSLPYIWAVSMWR